MSSSSAPVALKTDQTKCPFCDKVTYWSGRNKHIFSAKHLEEHVKPVLLKKDKYELMAYRKESKTMPCPKLSFVCGQEVKELHLCFGCKKAKEHLPSDHLYSCAHANEHRAAIKRLVEEIELGQYSTDCVESATPNMVGVCDEVAKLKNEVESLKKQLSDALDGSENLEAQDFMNEFCFQVYDMYFTDLSDTDKTCMISEAREGRVYIPV